MRYLKRHIETALNQYIKIFPVVGISGPRQSGKSTLLKKSLGNKYNYITFDDISNVNFFHSDPVGFMNTYSSTVIFDEVQYVPEIFRYIKIMVDNNRDKNGNYILTGSSQFSFMKNVTESLAGRIGLLSLLPFELSELPSQYRNKPLYLGSYPELYKLKYKNTSDWYSSYINTYIERDVRNLLNIGDLRDFSLFLRLLASKSAQILSLTDISKEIGIAVNTVKKWISILEASYIIFLLPPFYNNLGKRLVKRPKLYFFDTGLVTFLNGFVNFSDIDKTPFSGPIFENYVISEVYKRKIHSGLRPDLFFLKTGSGIEVDLIMLQQDKIKFIEIKNSSTFRVQMFKNIDSILPANSAAMVIYKGKMVNYKKNYSIKNYKDFLLEI